MSTQIHQPVLDRPDQPDPTSADPGAGPDEQTTGAGHTDPGDQTGAPGGDRGARKESQRRARAAMRDLLTPVRTRLRVAIGCQVLASVAAVVPFLAVAELGRLLLAAGTFDPAAPPAVAHAARWWVLAGAGALLARFVLIFAAGGLAHLADVDFQLDVRRRIAAHLGRVPLGWFTGRNSGEVKKALQDDVDAMHHAVAHALLDLTAALVTPLCALAYLVWVDWRMTLVTLLPVALGIYLYGRSMAGYSESMLAYDRALKRVNSSAVEFVEGITVVKTFGEARRAHQRFRQAAEDFSEFFLTWVSSVLRTSAGAQLALSPVAVLLVVLTGGTALVVTGFLPAADVLPFALLGLGLTAPLQTLSQTGEQIRTAHLAAGRVAELLETPELPAALHPEQPAGTHLSIRGVGFSYDGRSPVLRGVDAELAPGTVTALVGPSGAGKSTLASLLPRFWDPTEGGISIGGVDLRRMSAHELYRNVSFVLQDVALVRASVADSIRLGRPDAEWAQVEAAARAAQIHERITALPRGYDSVVGEDARLSGGEAQRVSIARALLADAPILVLDEATAFADPESEAAIQRALSELVVGRTLLVIAHRLSTVTGADQILVLDDGQVVERGRHPELVAAGGRYARLWAAHERVGPPSGRGPRVQAVGHDERDERDEQNQEQAL